MEILNPDKTYTYADYLTWQFDECVELFRGKILKMSPAPLRMHQDISSKLHGELAVFFKKKPCKLYSAPFDVRFPQKKEDTKDEQITTVFQPDLCVVCDIEKLDRRGCLGAPDWVIEILSDGNAPKEMREKYQVYEESGVREYWIIQPDTHSILPYVLENGIFIGKAPLLEGNDARPSIFPDLTLDLAYIFSE
jgi:Uma2 family endonuclease